MRAAFPSREATLAETCPGPHTPVDGSAPRIRAQTATSFNAPFQSDALRTHDARKIDAGGNNADISSWHVQARTHPRSLLVPTRFGTERDDLHLRKSPSIRLHSRE